MCALSQVTNAHIASYSAPLLDKYDCHLNVAVCASIEAVKYLYKYLHKGPDRAMVSAEHAEDEIAAFQDMRYIGAAEAGWRIMGFDLYEMKPAVVVLDLHQDGEQPVFWRDDQPGGPSNVPPTSTLLDFLSFCISPVQSRWLTDNWEGLRYIDFPKHFTYKAKEGWQPSRQPNRRFKSIGRMPVVPVNSRSEETFYLRILLNHLKVRDIQAIMARGAAREELTPMVSILRDGHPTFKAAAVALGLAMGDREWELAMEEANSCSTAPEMRGTFVSILVYCVPQDPVALFNAYAAPMSDDYLRDPALLRLAHTAGLDAADLARARALWEIRLELDMYNAEGALEQLPDVTTMEKEILGELQQELNAPATIRNELMYDAAQCMAKHRDDYAKIQRQPSQRACVDTIISAIDRKEARAFFINAYAGNGKTFVLQNVLDYVRGKGDIAVATAATGIAALLLDGCTTFHSRFNAPLNMTSEGTFNLTMQSAEAKLLAHKRTRVVLWDEAVMANKFLLSGLDRVLRLVREEPDLPFGGLVVLIGGDFWYATAPNWHPTPSACMPYVHTHIHTYIVHLCGCRVGSQTLPIQQHASRAQIVSLCLHRWPAWQGNVEVLTLQENMRCIRLLEGCTSNTQRDRVLRWSRWLRRLSDGDLLDEPQRNRQEGGQIHLWADQCHRMNAADDVEQMLSDVYDCPLNEMLSQPAKFWAERAVVAPKHIAVNHFNARMLERLPGHLVDCNGFDVLAPQHAGQIPVEMLAKIQPPGMPPKTLQLKKGAIVMLLRNMLRSFGLANGTRLQVIDIKPHTLHCIVLTGRHVDRQIHLPRIRLLPPDNKLPFEWWRIQFPVKLSYAMTINKCVPPTMHKCFLPLTLAFIMARQRLPQLPTHCLFLPIGPKGKRCDVLL